MSNSLVCKNMDETPVLARHPLHNAHRFKPKLPQPATRKGKTFNKRDFLASEGSETEGVSEEENEIPTPNVPRDHSSSTWQEMEGEDSGDELPSTQLIDPRPLAGLFVYVDVRSGADGCENRSAAISHQLTNLGATVCERFTKDVTHVVFKDGKLTTKERAEKKNVFLVSPLWVEASKRASDRVSEAKYPVLCKDGSDSPVVLGKIKRIKSMQPKELEVEITRSLERSRKRHKSDDKAKHAKRRALPALPSATTPLSMSALALPRDSLDSGNVDHANSDDEDDDFALPTFKLPGTPTSGTEQGGSATPGSGKQQRTRPTPKKGSKAAGVSVDEASGAGKRQTDLRPATALGEVGNEAGGGTVSGGGQRETSKKRRSGQQSAKKSEQQRKKRKECDSESGDGTAAKMATLEVKEDASKAASEETKGDSRKKRSSLKQASSNCKGSKVTKDTPPTKKKKLSVPPVPPSGKENADSAVAPDLQEATTKLKKGSAERLRKRRRVHLKNGSVFEKKKPSLVLTSIQPEDQDMILSIVDRLGRFEVSRTVCDTTTHVVCGSPRRTINILAATVMGCWVLSTDWVWKSVESGCWLDEEPYEMAEHFPSARLYRLERQAAGLLFRPRLFSPAGSVFVSSGCSNPPAQQLEKLLALAGGKVSGSQRKADVCIGSKSSKEEVKSVTEQWVLDSITAHELLPLEEYLLDNPRSRAGSPEL